MNRKLIVFCTALAGLGAFADDAYVQSTGSQAVDTGYYATPSTCVDIDFALDDLTQQQRPFGCEYTDAGLTFASYISGGNFYSWCCEDGAGSNWLWSKVPVSTSRVRIVLDSFAGKHSVYTNGILGDAQNLTHTRSRTSNYPLAVFAARNTTTDFGNFTKMKLYSMKIYEAGTLVREYVPYMRNGIVGVKDTVTGQVLGPAVGSALVAGNLADETVACTWTGAADSDWSNPANWQLGSETATVAPTAFDDVVIPAGSTVSVANLTTPAHSLTLSGSGTVTLTGNAACALAESLDIPSGVTLAAAAGSTLYVPAATVGGSALAAAVYTASTATWLSGAGRVAVNTVPGGTLENGILTYNVPAGLTQKHTDVLTAAITNVVKLGAGTLVVSNENNTAFVGTVEIRNGVLEAQSDTISDGTTTVPVLGRNDKNRFVVSKGAQLRIRCSGPVKQEHAVFKGTLVIAGDGPDNKGALYFIKAAAGYGNVDRLFSNVLLTDDASVSSSTRLGFSYGTINLGGHTLSHRKLTSPNAQFMNTSGALTNGTLRTMNGSDYILQGSPKLSADATLVIGTNCYLDAWNASPAFTGLTVFEEGAKFRVGAGTAQNNNKISGPARLDGRMYFSTYSATADLKATLAGRISGSGKLSTVAGTATSQHLYITCPSNNWTGGVIAEYGDIWATVSGTIPPGTIRSSSASGRLNFMVGPSGWDFASVHNILTNWDGNGAVNVYTAQGQSLTDDVDFTAAIPYRHGGPGTLTFTANVSPDGKSKLMNGEGTMVVPAASDDRYLSWLNVAGGTMVLDNAGLIYASERDAAGNLTLTNKNFQIGGANNTTNARLVVSGNTILGSLEVKAQAQSAKLFIGDSGTKGTILEVRDSAVITNGLHLGEYGKGAVHQYGGFFRDSSTAGNDGSMGLGANTGYGYYGLYGGTYSVRSWQALGRSKNAEGVFEQMGGTFTLDGGQFCISRGGNGEYYMAGGVFTQTVVSEPAIYLGNFSWADKTAGPMEAILTLAGDNPQMKLKSYLCISERTNTAVSVVNLNAGTLEASAMQKRWTGFADGNIKITGFKDVYAYVNFNGGAFRGTKANASIFGSGMNKADAVTVFAGGATIDVNGQALSNGEMPFVKPVGKGVASIALPSGAKVDGYIGAPKVSITGGGGAGATAHCSFDPATGRIGSIAVVSPGWGYTSAPTVTIKDGARTNTITCVATLTDGDPVSGGLTVTNSSTTAGTFTLSGTNTYAGATVVAGGTLKIATAQALPANGEVRCAGGTLDLNNLGTLTFNAFGGFGSVINGNVVANSLAFTADGCTNTLNLTGSLTLPDAATVDVSGVTSAFAQKKYVLLTAAGGITGSVGELTGFESLEHPQLWHVSKSGNSILLAYSRGTVLIFR